MKNLISICLIAIISLQLSVAQTTVTGKVTAKKDGTAISGATITAKGETTVTATSGSDGSYTIEVPAGVKVLEATATGMKTKTQGIGKKKTVNFTMMAESTEDDADDDSGTKEKEEKTKENKGKKGNN